MLLGRMIYYYLPSRSVFGIQATSLTKIFVLCDITAFILQAAGGSMASQGPTESQSQINRGLHIYMGGIGFQQLTILIFSLLAARLHYHLLQLEKNGVLAEMGKEKGWKKLLYTLYASLTWISVSLHFFQIPEYLLLTLNPRSALFSGSLNFLLQVTLAIFQTKKPYSTASTPFPCLLICTY